MNRFQLHHHHAIDFSYSCFDRMILRGGIPIFQHTQRGGTIVWFLRNRRQATTINRAYLGRIANDYHHWVTQYAHSHGIDIVQAHKDDRREQQLEPYFRQLGARPGVAVILKAREPERAAWHYARGNHIEVERHWVNLYYFYLNDPQCGHMFLRICPYFPCNIGVWLNGHHWLANQLQREGIDFEKRDNLFTACARPERLQQLADAFAPSDITNTVDYWLAQLLPYFSAAERAEGFRHQLYMAQMEYCHNLIFHNQVTANRLFDRLMDSNRSIGHPQKLAVVFGRQGFVPDTRTGQTVLKITTQRTPVISSSFLHTLLKQYISNCRGLRTESSIYQLKDLSLPKNINHLPKVRAALDRANQRYLDVQQDVMATYVDRGQLEQLRQPSVSASGRRIPGLHLDDPRLLAVWQAVLTFAYLVGKGCFRTKELLADVRKALANPDYTLAQLRYDLSKLRGKGLVCRLAGTQAYQVSSEGYRIGFYYLKLYQKLYAPLTAAIVEPVPDDHRLPQSRRKKLDKLYMAVDKALERLAAHIGIRAVA
jgi:hypothetical protein